MLVPAQNKELGLYFEDDKPDLDTLEHFGVFGMKWGVRKDRKTGSSRVRGKSKTATVKKPFDLSADSRNEHETIDKGLIVSIASTASATLSLGLKAAMAASNGASILAASQLAVLSSPLTTVALAAGAVTLTKKAVGLLSYKSKLAKYNKERETETVDKKTGLLKQKVKLSEEEDMKRINPAYGNIKSGSKNNCFICSMAYDLRRRGYDVRAKGATQGYNTKELSAFYPNVKVSKQSTSVSKTFTEIKKQGEGARGSFFVRWTGGGGHSIAYEVKNGKVELFDCQSAKHYGELSALAMLQMAGSYYSYARTDNCDFDATNMKLVVE